MVRKMERRMPFARPPASTSRPPRCERWLHFRAPRAFRRLHGLAMSVCGHFQAGRRSHQHGAERDPSCGQFFERDRTNREKRRSITERTARLELPSRSRGAGSKRRSFQMDVVLKASGPGGDPSARRPVRTRLFRERALSKRRSLGDVRFGADGAKPRTVARRPFDPAPPPASALDEPGRASAVTTRARRGMRSGVPFGSSQRRVRCARLA